VTYRTQQVFGNCSQMPQTSGTLVTDGSVMQTQRRSRTTRFLFISVNRLVTLQWNLSWQIGRGWIPPPSHRTLGYLNLTLYCWAGFVNCLVYVPLMRTSMADWKAQDTHRRGVHYNNVLSLKCGQEIECRFDIVEVLTSNFTDSK
jgi:hypothetical protein